jgi:hypothetical protein
MATNNRPLKAFIRYDGSGRAVSSSLIWRKNKPKVGNWKEVQGYECCNPSNTTRLVGTFNPSSNFFSIQYIGNSNIFTANAYTGTTGEEWLEYFNTHFGWMGTFSLNPENPEGSIFFDIKTEIFNSLGNPAEFQFFYVGSA